MARTSDKSVHSCITIAIGALAALFLVGCESGQRVYPDAQPARSPAAQSMGVYLYPPVPQVVTSDSLDGILARYRGRPLLLCLWSANHPRIIPALHESEQVRAGYRSAQLLGINLDPPEAWLAATVPMLRQAGTRFPCVTLPESQQDAILQRLGLREPPASVTYLLLNETGQPQLTRRAFEPSGTPLLAASPAPTSQPAAAAALPAAPAATQLSSAAAPRRQVLAYRLRLVRLNDGKLLHEFAGICRPQAAPVRSEAEPWLSVLGVGIASQVPDRQAIAIGFIQVEGDQAGQGTFDLDRFCTDLASAIEEAGRRVVSPSAVQQLGRDLGLTPNLVAARPAILASRLAAGYLVTGTLRSLGPDQAE